MGGIAGSICGYLSFLGVPKGREVVVTKDSATRVVLHTILQNLVSNGPLHNSGFHRNAT